MLPHLGAESRCFNAKIAIDAPVSDCSIINRVKTTIPLLIGRLPKLGALVCATWLFSVLPVSQAAVSPDSENGDISQSSLQNNSSEASDTQAIKSQANPDKDNSTENNGAEKTDSNASNLQAQGIHGNKAVVITINAAIGPASKDYFLRSLEKANEIGASILIIKLNTPGGLDSSMRDMIQAILSSRIPVVTYVSPSGSRAASAGTYIMYASHIAVMAPATNLGAATPVQIGGGMTPDKPGTKPTDTNEKPSGTKPPEAKQPPADAMSKKMVNDAVAYIRGLAELRNRNSEWAEKAVREAASLPAKDALAKNVIDLIADDVDDLLKKIHGRKITVAGQEVELDTRNAEVVNIEPDWRNRLLAIITDPNIAYILMLIGIYGLIFEFSNPGALIPGIIGAISLFLALFAFQVLPVNYAGFGLILLGIVLMVAEAYAPSFGALGIGGVIAFVIGSIILMDTDVPGFGISPVLVGSIALVSSAVFTLILVMLFKSRQKPVVSGQEYIVGSNAEVVDDFDQSGYVHLQGENWSARSHTPLKKGQIVRVVKIDGLTLWVESPGNGHEEGVQQ